MKDRWTHLIAAVIMSLVPTLARGASSDPPCSRRRPGAAQQ